MALIDSPRLTKHDRESWADRELADEAWAQTAIFRRHVDAAKRALSEFVEVGEPGYIGVSWGKDSVCVAHLAVTLGCPWPLVWVCMQPVDNPDCPLVRDAFLSRFHTNYDEIVMPYDPKAKRTSFPGFAEAARRHGQRYVSGVRGAESSTRRMSIATHGWSTARTCRPLAIWSAADVFAYLRLHDLPVHPAYAMSMGGLLEREHLRVGAIGGERGTGWGRRQWEERYYGDALRQIDRARLAK